MQGRDVMQQNGCKIATDQSRIQIQAHRQIYIYA